ncbi:RDD family protein [Bdellovibrio sp. HCB274]|uniref:RDD family protein n=1 Tax=Bdellovibrio sp. HCB274 TaxID=3394361 RepID=UPI0039B41D5D
MLFPDLSAPEINNSKQFEGKPAIAFLMDRFIAFILDFLIVSPIISLMVSGLLRQTKTFFLLNSRSEEGLVAVMMLFAVGTIGVVVMQTLSLFFLQATPGQYFLQLRVVSYPNAQKRLTFSQCVTRSVSWCGSFLLLGLPFLGVVGHPLRRAFHEKASDTMVVTLKKSFDPGPSLPEQRLMTSWMQFSFAMFALVAFVGLAKSYQSLSAGEYHTASEATASCQEIPDKDLNGAQRMDAALSLFLLKEISSDCLNKESEHSLWGDPVNSQAMAYFAKYLLSEGDERKEYFSKVCESRTSSGCILATYLDNPDDVKLGDASRKLWVTQVLEADHLYSQKDFVGSLEVIENLQSVPALRQAIDKKYVRSIWALKESLGTRKGGRVPASTSDAQEWIDGFKEKYGVR